MGSEGVLVTLTQEEVDEIAAGIEKEKAEEAEKKSKKSNTTKSE